MPEDTTLGYFQNHHRYVELNDITVTIQAEIFEFVHSKFVNFSIRVV